MRVRKWRIWNKTDEEMIYINGIYINYEKKLLDVFDDLVVSTYSLDEVEIMDYIDHYALPKNVDFYEGDIVTCKHWKDEPHVLFYSNNGSAYMIHIFELQTPVAFISDELAINFKLLGNIYENEKDFT